VPKEDSVSETTPVQAETASPVIDIKLPCGLLKDGVSVVDAGVIPMTGLTRKAISSENVRSNPMKITDVIFLQCLKRIGTSNLINNKILNELLIGDRDFLMLEIRRVSMGSIITATVECGGCNKKIEVKFDLSEIKTKTLAECRSEIVDGVRGFWIKNDEPRVNAFFRFPNGGDQAVVLPLLHKNPIDANYKLYALCLMDWDGEKRKFASDFFEKMNTNLLDIIDAAFSENQPGPDLTQSVSCPVCAEDIEMTFQGSDFLFRQHKKEKGS
jgi:hypothetical protein